jgi:hypothetical protein
MKRRSLLLGLLSAAAAPIVPAAVKPVLPFGVYVDAMGNVPVPWAHQHGVYDPGHSHGICSDEELACYEHSHSVTDPGHTHGIHIYRGGL